MTFVFLKTLSFSLYGAPNLLSQWCGMVLKLSILSPRGAWGKDTIYPHTLLLYVWRNYLCVCVCVYPTIGWWWDLGTICINRGRLRVSCLLFADDILLFCKAKESLFQLMMSILDICCSESGLNLNMQSLNLYALKGCEGMFIWDCIQLLQRERLRIFYIHWFP